MDLLEELQKKKGAMAKFVTNEMKLDANEEEKVDKTRDAKHDLMERIRAERGGAQVESDYSYGSEQDMGMRVSAKKGKMEH